jgi:hypothetical protein
MQVKSVSECECGARGAAMRSFYGAIWGHMGPDWGRTTWLPSDGRSTSESDARQCCRIARRRTCRRSPWSPHGPSPSGNGLRSALALREKRCVGPHWCGGCQRERPAPTHRARLPRRRASAGCCPSSPPPRGAAARTRSSHAIAQIQTGQNCPRLNRAEVQAEPRSGQCQGITSQLRWGNM